MLLVASELKYFNETMKTVLIRINKFQLFDSVNINETIALSDGGTAPEGAVCMVELFDG